MKLDNIIKLSLSIIMCEFAGVIGSVVTIPGVKEWFVNLQKPVFNPPNWLFAPVWSLLFLLMGISFYLVWDKNWQVKNKINWFKNLFNKFSDKTKAIAIFFIQLILNIFWSFLFFGFHNPTLSFFELLLLWIAIFLTIVYFYRVSKWAGYLLLPYIVWVSFAGVLNLFLWILN